MMKKPLLIIALFAAFLFAACSNKKEANSEYVNPVFKENLTEIFDIISKRYIVDFSQVKKVFGDSTFVTIDSVQSEANENVYDSTFVFRYKKIDFYFYKRSLDKKFFLTEIDLRGDFKAKQFVLASGTTKEEFISLFGNPITDTFDENSNYEEIAYSLFKDEENAYYDSFIFMFRDEKFIGMKYIPYVEIYPQSGDKAEEVKTTGAE